VHTCACISDPYIWVIKKCLIFWKFHCHQKVFDYQKVFDFASCPFCCCACFISIVSCFKPRCSLVGITGEHPAYCFGMPLFAAIVAISFKFVILFVSIAIASYSTRKVYVVVVVSSSVVPILLFGTFICPMSSYLTIIANTVKCQKCDLIAFFRHT
jgi:hypothetical protein